jgi:hypothetical protein
LEQRAIPGAHPKQHARHEARRELAAAFGPDAVSFYGGASSYVDLYTRGMPGVFKIFFVDVVTNMARAAGQLSIPASIYGEGQRRSSSSSSTILCSVPSAWGSPLRWPTSSSSVTSARWTSTPRASCTWAMFFVVAVRILCSRRLDGTPQPFFVLAGGSCSRKATTSTSSARRQRQDHQEHQAQRQVRRVQQEALPRLQRWPAVQEPQARRLVHLRA